MTPAIAALIAEAERLDKEATGGPWRDEWDLIADRSETEQTAIARDGEGAYGVVVGMGWYDGPHLVLRKADAAFIAAARTLLPAIASALRRAERVVEAARVLDRLATPPMQPDAWGALDAALRAHDQPDATGETGREGGR